MKQLDDLYAKFPKAVDKLTYIRIATDSACYLAKVVETYPSLFTKEVTKELFEDFVFPLVFPDQK